VVIGGGRGTVLSESITPQQCVLEAVTPVTGVLVLSELAYPGWKAYSRGKQFPVQRAHKIFRAIVLPPGQYIDDDRIFFVFRPVAWFAGIVITILSLLVVFVHSLWHITHPRQFVCRHAAAR
jgi:uncharacterized membrane protein YfhO